MGKHVGLDIKLMCARQASGIFFIKYAYNPKIGKTNKGSKYDS